MNKEKVIVLLEKLKEFLKDKKAPVFNVVDFIDNPFKCLVYAILSTRTKDEVTLKIAKLLFDKVKNIDDLINIDEKELENLLKGVGFYRNKAKMLKRLAYILKHDYNSKIPNNKRDLMKLPGVGNKVANVVLAYAFNRDAIAVDTHVHRISNRLGLVNTKDPKETEKELYKIIPKKYWREINTLFVAFGQLICKPKKPKCNECPIKEFCKYYRKKINANSYTT